MFKIILYCPVSHFSVDKFFSGKDKTSKEQRAEKKEHGDNGFD